MADQPKRPHPDVADAVIGANTSRNYHIERIACMDGSVAERYEQLRNNPPSYPVPNPPAGEYCVALLRNSADVNASPERLNTRPETSLLAPYLGIMVERQQPGTASAASALSNEMVRRATLPENQNQENSVSFGTTNPPFLLTPGAALDAAFTQTVMRARSPNASIPPRPQGNLDELHAITDSCFRNTGVTLGQCAQAGRDQAALYLNQGDAPSQAVSPGATPAVAPHAQQGRSRTN